jgi:hypothetical protein
MLYCDWHGSAGFGHIAVCRDFRDTMFHYSFLPLLAYIQGNVTCRAERERVAAF